MSENITERGETDMSEQESVNQNAVTSSPNGSQISEMIDKLLANPEIIEMVVIKKENVK